MPLRYGNESYAALVGELAQKAGQAVAQREATQRAEEAAAQKREINARKELAQFNADLQLQSQKLSQAWELEKMQRRSELEFQNEQKGIQLAQDMKLQEEAKSKQHYMSAVEFIDTDDTLDNNEKAQLKRAAYLKMVAQVDIADRALFPQAYENQGLAALLGQGQQSGTTAQSPNAVVNVPQQYTKEVVDATQQALLQLGPNASEAAVEQKAREIRLQQIEDEILPRVQEKLGPQASEAEIMNAVKQQAMTELQVRENYMESGNIKPPAAKFNMDNVDITQPINPGGWYAARQLEMFADKARKEAKAYSPEERVQTGLTNTAKSLYRRR